MEDMWNRICTVVLGAMLFIANSAVSAAAVPGQTDPVKDGGTVPAVSRGQTEAQEQGRVVRETPSRTPAEPVPDPSVQGQAPAASVPSAQPQVKEPAAPAGMEPVQQSAVHQDPPQASAEKKIVINIASRSLALYQGNEKIRLYPLGLGTPYTPTPVGYYKIRSKDVNPTWIDPSDLSVVVPSGENNPLGYRWMLLQGNYGIHGTNRPDSIGHYVSNGCIRMKEADVEALFELVDIGTPVEITYNRIVVEKLKDNTVVYYIYPDGYDRQPVDVALVNKWLSGYGISSFESDEDIREKIAKSDGEPTYIGKVYNAFVNGKRIAGKAVVAGDVTYLPALDVSQALSMDLQWKSEEKALVTPYGMAMGYDKKGVLYFDAADSMALFHMEGALDGSNSYVLRTKEIPVPAPIPTAPAKEPVPSVSQDTDRPVPIYERQKSPTQNMKESKAAEEREAVR